MRTVFKNGLLICVAIALALLAAEGASRLVLSPVDFLLPKIERHAALNHRIIPYSAGHDALGFRNESVIPRAPIIAIGDSMTYGVAASHHDSWPRQLQRLIDKPVYNMALGGYGPLHYLHLLKELALPMEPELVIVGLYFGNDLMDAYNLVYSNDSWTHLRRAEQGLHVDAQELIDLPVDSKRFATLRNWLAQNSIVYRVVTQSALANPVRHAEITGGSRDTLELKVPGGVTYLTPGSRSAALNLSDLKVVEGLELTIHSIREIYSHSLEAGIEVLVLLIPTKENVYRDMVREQPVDLAGSEFSILIEYEEKVKGRIVSVLEELGVSYLDVLSPMREAAVSEAIFPVNDGHPNSIGYSIIAGEVASWMDGRVVSH